MITIDWIFLNRDIYLILILCFARIHEKLNEITCSYNKNTDALGWRFSFTSLFAFPLFVFMFFFAVLICDLFLNVFSTIPFHLFFFLGILIILFDLLCQFSFILRYIFHFGFHIRAHKQSEIRATKHLGPQGALQCRLQITT